MRNSPAQPDFSQIGMGAARDEPPLNIGGGVGAVLWELSRLDDGLVQTLQSGHIRLLSSQWVLALPDDARIQRRQDLEEDEQAGRSPLLSPEDAVRLVLSGERAVGVLSYGWLSPGNPDPAGMRLRALKHALSECTHIRAVFWDYASLPQRPRAKPGEDEAFDAALKVMGDLYASAVGTTVLQLKEIPDRPPELDGCVYLGDLREEKCTYRENRWSLDQTAIEAVWPVQTFGKVIVKSIRILPDVREAVVVFTSHKYAEDAIRKECPPFCKWIALLYNMRPYDERGWSAQYCARVALLHRTHAL